MSSEDLELCWMEAHGNISFYIQRRSLDPSLSAYSLSVITMGKQQKWQFKKEKHLSTWLNTQMSSRTRMPCVHACLSGHTPSISHSNLLYMGNYVRPNEGRADVCTWVCVWFISMFHYSWQWHEATATSIFSPIHSFTRTHHRALDQKEKMHCKSKLWITIPKTSFAFFRFWKMTCRLQ